MSMPSLLSSCRNECQGCCTGFSEADVLTCSVGIVVPLAVRTAAPDCGALEAEGATRDEAELDDEVADRVVPDAVVAVAVVAVAVVADGVFFSWADGIGAD
jgi:hypothetical protein